MNNMYVTGQTKSTNFPTTSGAYKTTLTGTADVFISKLNLSGNGVHDLLYSTYLGGSSTASTSSNEFGYSIAVDSAGNVYITGVTPSTDFPVTSDAFQKVNNGGFFDVFISKLILSGNGTNDLLYSTYFGGSGSDQVLSIVVDSAGNAYVGGTTHSADLPVTSNAYMTTYNSGTTGDAFVAKLFFAASAPTADFTASPVSGTAPLAVSFSDQSTNTPMSWAWDFNNDGVVDSTLQNSNYTYSVPGIYTVNLTASNAGGSNSMVKTGYIVVNEAPPVADFTATPMSGSAPLTVQFSDASTGNVAGWAWDFNNDGIIDSTDRNASNTYSNIGTYTVNLTVTGPDGSNSMVKTGFITVSTLPAPVAAFTSNVTSGMRPLSVQFTDQSTGSPTSWNWEYRTGSGSWTSFSTSQSPSYTFSTAGTYDVRLTATNAGGSNVTASTGYIKVLPQCDLNISGLVNPVPASAVFCMEPNPVTIANVKNLGPDTVTNIPVYLYVSDVSGGLVPVNSTTIASLASGATTNVQLTDPTIRPATANSVYGSSGLGYLTFTAKVDPYNVIPETNEANNNKTSASKPIYYNGYKGKLYEYNGNNTTTQHIYDLHGGIVYYTQPDSAYQGVGWTSRTESWTSDNLPIPANASVVQALLYVDYNWDTTPGGQPSWTTTFNGVSIPITPGNPYIDQSNFGAYANYKYGLYMYDITSLFSRSGNTLTMTPQTSNSQALYPSTIVVIYSDPSATRKQIFINEECDELLLSQSTYGTNLTEATAFVPFTGMSIDLANMTSATLSAFAGSAGPGEGNLLFNNIGIATGAWQGNADTASAQVFDVTNYVTADNNVAAIQGTTSGGMNTLQQFLVIEYKPTAVLPVADFTANTTSGNAPLTVQFSDLSSGTISTYAWDFDNNGIVDSTLQNPEYTYATAGTYSVNLTVTGPGGSDSEVKIGHITVSEVPPVILVNATMTGSVMPVMMSAGESYSVSVTVRNTGVLSWNESSMFRLGMVDDNSGDAYKFDGTTARIWLPDGANVLPGQSVTFDYVMTAPAAGEYHPSYRMVWEDHQWFGEQINTTVSVIGPTLGATVTGNTIPTSMTAGTPYTVTVTAQNTGSMPWNESNMFRLGMINDENGDAYKFNGSTARIWLPESTNVLPGESYTFSFAMNPMVAPGTYHPSYRMVWEDHQWFGDTITSTVNVVGPDATITGDTIPTSMTTGQTYNASITVQNTGSMPWNESNMFRLGMLNDENGDAYKFNGTTARIWLPESANVLPGQSITFDYTMTAPTTGTYHPTYKMVWENHEWYGTALTREITVE